MQEITKVWSASLQEMFEVWSASLQETSEKQMYICKEIYMYLLNDYCIYVF